MDNESLPPGTLAFITLSFNERGLRGLGPAATASTMSGGDFFLSVVPACPLLCVVLSLRCCDLIFSEGLQELSKWCAAHPVDVDENATGHRQARSHDQVLRFDRLMTMQCCGAVPCQCSWLSICLCLWWWWCNCDLDFLLGKYTVSLSAHKVRPCTYCAIIDRNRGFDNLRQVMDWEFQCSNCFHFLPFCFASLFCWYAKTRILMRCHDFCGCPLLHFVEQPWFWQPN